jgi:hypothetical protein
MSSGFDATLFLSWLEIFLALCSSSSRWQLAGNIVVISTHMESVLGVMVFLCRFKLLCDVS